MNNFNYSDDFKKYKTAQDVYNEFPMLIDFNKEEIIKLGLTMCKSADENNNIHDFYLASACRALMILDKTKFNAD